MRNFKGFTLSEVLITLGVIGVVSATTLPTVINKAQLFILKNQYKRVYSNYSNALQKYILDNDGIPNCTYGNSFTWQDCSNLYSKIMQNMKYVKYCANNALANGCVPKYSSYISETSGCSGFSENTINNVSRVWILNDGSSLITYSYGNMPIFAVDINGMKGPNKGGYDLFSFSIEKKGDTAILSANGCIPIEKGGIKPSSNFTKIYE